MTSKSAGQGVVSNVLDYADSVAIGKVTGNGRNDLVVNGTFGIDGYLWMFPREGDGKLGENEVVRTEPRDFSSSAHGTAG